ncbi:phage tail protein [Acetobacter estunensis]|uniref:phage tail protein n=1 Tax=Acetobacter estunensis TaxID=104097 RepID=UPI001C2D37BF|nr:phage tail protein [Acetobacter estunensis]MBV1838616.1 phage tail protein [Acetobacter estunensis]
MSDISHVVGADISVSDSGDLLVASNADLGNQRVLRRLCTNVGDYIFSLEYGAGLPGRVGGTDTQADIEAIVLQQMTLESSVSQTQTPSVALTTPALGTRRISISYISTATGETSSVEL